MDLVRAGVLEEVTGRRAAQLTATSFRVWMAGRHPDDPANPTTPPTRRPRQPDSWRLRARHPASGCSRWCHCYLFADWH